ncbi:hypothetical protein MRX96_055192 [Rhipicephalus microplus]
MLPVKRHLVPSSHLEGDVCVGPLCRYVANSLRSKLASDVDPCSDFYRYVCGKYRGWSTFTEAIELVQWMSNMNLDFLDTKRIESVDPVEIMVRGSLDFGVKAIISIRLDDREFPHFKREIEINYSVEQEEWLKDRSYRMASTNEFYYGMLFLKYGVQRGQDFILAKKMLAYEERLRQIENSTVDWDDAWFTKINGLGLRTSPYVSRDEWVILFSKYTEGIYTGGDFIRHFTHSTSIIKKLFQDKHVGRIGLQYLVAWSIYRQLAKFTDPELMRGYRKAEESCFLLIRDVMRLAILSHYFRSQTPPSMIKNAKFMAYKIRIFLSAGPELLQLAHRKYPRKFCGPVEQN